MNRLSFALKELTVRVAASRRGPGRDAAAQRHDAVALRRRARDREPVQRPALAAGHAGDQRAPRRLLPGGSGDAPCWWRWPCDGHGRELLRITLLVVVAHYAGSPGGGTFHDVSGYLTYGLSLAACWRRGCGCVRGRRARAGDMRIVAVFALLASTAAYVLLHPPRISRRATGRWRLPAVFGLWNGSELSFATPCWTS